MRQDVPLGQAGRLHNHGPTVLVSSAHAGRRHVMAAAWSMPVEFAPHNAELHTLHHLGGGLFALPGATLQARRL